MTTGSLIDAGVLVGTGKLDQVVNVDAGTGFVMFILIDLDYYAGSIHGFHHAVMAGDDRHARITSHYAFHAGSHQRRVSPKKRYCLTLHVGTHESTVGVVVFQKRNQRSGN